MPLTTLRAGAFPSGAVLQTLSAEKTTSQSTNAQVPSYTDITGLSVAITPSSTSSKILVMVSLALGFDDNDFAYARIMRDSTQISAADTDGNRPKVSFHTYDADNDGLLPKQTHIVLDSPSTTSATTYKVQFGGASSSYDVHINRSTRHSNNTYADPIQTSTITVMEIKG